jgi:DNA modification methylase
MSVRILHGDCRQVLATLPDASVHCCVTSPPYFGLRDYGVDGQIGLEPTPAEFVEQIVGVMREVRRVLRDDGTLWLNLGDSYAGSWGARGRGDSTNAARPDLESKHGTDAPNRHGFAPLGIKPKDLIGVPKAGCPIGGTVLDPFGGAGTTGLVADGLQRSAVLIDLNPAYIDIAQRRITGDAPLFAEVAA